jgi:L-iditol 2-dehydrogenase
MRAVVLFAPGKMAYQEVETPHPKEGGVVLKIGAALTCGTDLKTFLRGHPKMPTPTLFGHEFSGTVTEVGQGVKNVREGDEVMLVPTAPCGGCYYCLREEENLCTTLMETMLLGGYAEYIKVPARIVQKNLFPKPSSLSFTQAALLEPLSCVIHGLEHIRLRPDDTIVIIGAGAIGLLHLLVLKALGIEKVYVVARNPQRAQAACSFGAYQVILRDVSEARDEIFADTQGRGADIVIECTGQPKVWEEATGLARPGGQVVLFGGCPSGTQVSFDTCRLHYDQVKISSPFHFTPRAVHKAYQLLVEGRISGCALISGTFPLGKIKEAFTLLRNGQGIKYAITP